MLPFSIDELNSEIAEGYVTERFHPTLPLRVLNYAPRVPVEKRWNNVTLNCRGLILDAQDNIVARPWKKFFNLGEVTLPIQFDDPVEVMDKVDGSLGILYPMVIDTPEVFDIVYGVSTRGSFSSEQAEHATKIWQEKYSNLDPYIGYTMLFEIVYPANRIVLDYQNQDDLVLLGAVQNETGYYVGPGTAKFMWHQRGGEWDDVQWPGPVVGTFDYNTISGALAHMDRENAEGYVIRSHNFLVKMKQPDYLDLHRLVTNCSPRTVWEQLRDGKSRTEILSVFPDEFHDYVASMIDPLQDRYDERLSEVYNGYCDALNEVENKYGEDGPATMPPRAEYAKVFTKHKDKAYYFLLLDHKPVKSVLWAELRPRVTEEKDV